MHGSGRQWRWGAAVGTGAVDSVPSREEGIISVVDMTKTEICGRLRATDEFGSVTDMTKNGNEFDVLRDDG